MSYAVTTQMDIYPEKMEEFISVITELADATREAAGCILHNICMDAEQKGRMFVYSAWESIDQYKDYLDWDRKRGMAEMLKLFLKEPPVSHSYGRIN